MGSQPGPTLIFDGDCGFCTTTANWIGRRLPAGAEVVPWQFRDDLDQLGLTVDDVNEKVWWIDDGGALHGGHHAIGQALISAGGVWRLLGHISLIPPISWVGALVYRVISANRHRMPGGTPACRIDSR